MSIKLILCDFDGTVTQGDVLDEICAISGKLDESRKINEQFISGNLDGLSALKQRFRLIKGIDKTQIENSILPNVKLNNGAETFFNYARKKNIPAFLLSGNAEFVLEYFCKKLHITFFSGSTLSIDNGKIGDFITYQNKFSVAENYIKKHNLIGDEIVAIGNSIADAQLFEMSAHPFIINKKEDFNTNAVSVNSFTEIMFCLKPYL